MGFTGLMIMINVATFALVAFFLFFVIRDKGPLYLSVTLTQPDWKSIDSFPIPEELEMALITDGKKVKIQELKCGDYSQRGRLSFDYRNLVTHWDYPPAPPKDCKEII